MKIYAVTKRMTSRRKASTRITRSIPSKTQVVTDNGKETAMYKVKWCNTGGEESTEEFRTEREMCICIYDEMQKQYDLLCGEYPNEDITWLNRYLDCGNVTEVYIPDTNICISCEIIIDGLYIPTTLEEW